MKSLGFFLVLLFLSIACVGNGGTSGAPINNSNVKFSDQAKNILNTTVVVGASLSNNYAAESPGEKATKIVGTHSQFTKQAVNGIKGSELVPKLNITNGTTAIIGVDLFFWDTTTNDCSPGLNAIDQIISMARADNINLVLSSVPPIKASQPCMNVINTAIEKYCIKQNQCYFLDLKTMFINLAQGGVIAYDGNNYVLNDLMHDQLHPNDLGSSIIASMILELIN